MLEHQQFANCRSLKQVFCSGEALQLKQVLAFQTIMPEVELHNLYGPTEAAIDVSFWNCLQLDGATVPIGKAIQNIQLLVLDTELNPVPKGCCGELFIGGDGLARGYLNRSTLTAEKFVANPYHAAGQTDSSARLYKTGDLVRRLKDGNLEFIGRTDHQVKIRGLRIELGEIEGQLSAHDNVESALVVAHNADKAGPQLVAYVKTSAGCSWPELRKSLKTKLAAELPAYMVPAIWILIEKWPLTSNGKVNRKALPQVIYGAVSDENVAARTEVETILVDIWSKILNLKADEISTRSNFFELGGHSLMAIQMVNKLNDRFAANIAIAQLYDRLTIEAVASFIDDLLSIEQESCADTEDFEEFAL